MSVLDENEFLEFRQSTPKGRRPLRGRKKAEKPAKTAKRHKKKLGEMNIVLYLRKSTEEEERQFNSTRDQEKKCLAYIKSLEENTGETLHIVKTYEEHCSAAHAGKRELFNEMLQGIQAGKFDAILAYHPDRLSRNMLEAGVLLDMIRPDKGEDVGVLQDLLFPTVSFSNDSGGRLMLAVLFSMATQCSDHLSEVVQRGVDSNLEKGKSSGTPKWGYVRNRVTGYYEPDEKCFDVMRKGWEMILDGKSQAEVLDYWKDHDVHYYTIEGANKVSRKITLKHKTQIGRILRDPFYFGVLTQGGNEVDLRDIPAANFEPMVTEEEYNKVQEILNSSYQTHRKTKSKDDPFIPFQGMVICKECGRKLYGYAGGHHKDHKLVYYGHQNKAAKDDCERLKTKGVANEIRGNVILDEIYAVLDKIKPTKQDYKRYLEVASTYTEEKKDELSQERRSKLGALSSYKQELTEKTEAYKAMSKRGNAPGAALDSSKRQIEELQTNIVRLEGEVEELTDKIKRPEQILLTEAEFLNLLKNAPQQMRKADFVGKDILLRSIFLNLQIDKQNKATFLCKPEFDGLISSPNVTNGGDMWT